ncbi:MAG: hypothetical protein FWC68_04480, partial [Oscillospiraceae bacterium]|nr:hypothetical protein [Oscillospiraceae bacterium]
EQKELNKKIPFRVKYHKDYLWQIHYSEFTDQYFMLVPTEDQEQSCFFYLLRKILTKKTRGKIFVPICYSEYSTDYLKRSEIEELEKFIWYFTKEWPLVYDVYDKKDKLTIHITGETYIYENAKSPYCIKLSNREDAIKFYKLLKAIFILATEAPKYYSFKLKINEKGGFDFYSNNNKLDYETSSEFVKNEYAKIEEHEKDTTNEISDLESKLEEIKIETGILELEYLQKEREVTTFLECKKTFFGKVKYFFGKKKRVDNSINPKTIVGATLQGDPTDKNNPDSGNDVHIAINTMPKEFYTLEELIDRYKKLEREVIHVKNLKADIAAGEYKIKNMKLKIKNAVLYLQEIDKHTKSIFEFWRFTNKDKIENLAEAEIVEENVKRLKRTFDIHLDLDNLAKELDKKQRGLLNKEELNSIYVATTDIIADINKIANKKAITKERIEELKQDALEEKRLLDNEAFDIFGNISADKTKINILANKKHREVRKEKNKLLEITKNTTIKEYTGYLQATLKNLQSAFTKTNIDVEMSVYKIVETEELEGNLNVFNIDITNVITNVGVDDPVHPTTIYKLNLTENTPAIGLTNIVYYNNYNETLPLGMDISKGVLLDTSLLKLEVVNEEEFKVVEYIEDENQADIAIRTIMLKEFNIT